MHIGYPYQDEYIALGQALPRTPVIDLCWAWIINPAACVRFVKEFLLAAPANKLLDLRRRLRRSRERRRPRRIARQGLAAGARRAGRRGLADASATRSTLVEPLMRGNARALFPIFGVPA